MSKQTYAKDGHIFMRVVTPQVAAEYEIPLSGELTGEALRDYKRLLDLADRHGTTINSST